jgi:hypothetical protein
MLRIGGYIAITLGALALCGGVGSVKAPRNSEDEVLGQGLQQRLDAVIPGSLLIVIGVVLLAMNRPSKAIDAVPAEQWFPITLTPDAAEFARRTIAERKHPPGSGLRIADGHRSKSLEVQFDLPSEGTDDWMGEHLGIPVFADRSLVDAASGKTIELSGDRLTLKS